MNRNFLSVLLCTGILFTSCKQVPEKTAGIEGDFSGTLTSEEIEGGVLTAEILWKFVAFQSHCIHRQPASRQGNPETGKGIRG